MSWCGNMVDTCYSSKESNIVKSSTLNTTKEQNKRRKKGHHRHIHNMPDKCNTYKKKQSGNDRQTCNEGKNLSCLSALSCFLFLFLLFFFSLSFLFFSHTFAFPDHPHAQAVTARECWGACLQVQRTPWDSLLQSEAKARWKHKQMLSTKPEKKKQDLVKEWHRDGDISID